MWDFSVCKCRNLNDLVIFELRFKNKAKNEENYKPSATNLARVRFLSSVYQYVCS